MSKLELSARNALVERHLHLVPPIAASVSKRLPGVFSREDLAQTGNLGLLKAADRYRPELHNSTPFECYARPIIRGAILDSVRRRKYRDATQLHLVEDYGDSKEKPVNNRLASPDPNNIEVSIDSARDAERIRAAVRWLKPVERAVIAAHYGQGETLRDSAKIVDISRAKASKVHGEALEGLRKRLRIA